MKACYCVECQGLRTHPKRTFKVGDAVQTRDGRKAEIIRDLRDDIHPLAVVVTEPDGRQWVSSFGPQGQFSVREKPEDLIPAPRKRTVWANFYPDGSRDADMNIFAYNSRREADSAASREQRIACLRLEIEEGRFDD